MPIFTAQRVRVGSGSVTGGGIVSFVFRLLRWRATREESPSTWGESGYRNWWGGFHYVTDREAYFRLIVLILKKPWNKQFWKLGSIYIWRRWVHRRCDTTDFHHDIYCMLDPWVRKREREYQWEKVWKGYFADET